MDVMDETTDTYGMDLIDRLPTLTEVDQRIIENAAERKVLNRLRKIVLETSEAVAWRDSNANQS